MILMSSRADSASAQPHGCWNLRKPWLKHRTNWKSLRSVPPKPNRLQRRSGGTLLLGAERTAKAKGRGEAARAAKCNQCSGAGDTETGKLLSAPAAPDVTVA